MSGYTPIRQTTNLRSVGSCIYCGALDDLSDEHIIPFGLNGTLVLPASSCPQCARITSSFEQQVLRGFMLPARAVGRMRTRRPKESPTALEMQLVDGDDVRDVTLPISRFPALLQLPLFQQAGVLAGRPAATVVTVVGVETIRFGTHPIDALKSLLARSLRQTVQIDVNAFARMVAKIGYSYFVGTKGSLPLSEVKVLPFIRGDSDDGGMWVGSSRFTTEAERAGALHVIAISEVRGRENPSLRGDLALVKLFASSGASGYAVVLTLPDTSAIVEDPPA